MKDKGFGISKSCMALSSYITLGKSLRFSGFQPHHLRKRKREKRRRRRLALVLVEMMKVSTDVALIKPLGVVWGVMAVKELTV